MAEGCSSYPTLTRTDEVRTESIVTTFMTTTTTVPPSLTTLTLTPSCTLQSCSSPAPTVITTSVPGYTSTIQVPVLQTIAIDSTTVTTLWGSSCSRTPTQSESGSSSASRSVSRTQSLSASEITSVSVYTRSDGGVTSSVVTVIATPLDQDTGTSGGKTNLAPIIGGAAGAAAGLVIAALAMWYYLKKRATKAGFDNLFNKAAGQADMYHDHKNDPGTAAPSHQQQGYQPKSSQQQQQQRPATDSQHPQDSSQLSQQQSDAPQQDAQQSEMQDQGDQQEDNNEPKDEKQRLRKVYEAADQVVGHAPMSAGDRPTSVTSAHSIADQSRYYNQSIAGPSTAMGHPHPSAGGYYNPVISQFPPVPHNGVQYPGHTPAASIPGPSYGQYPVGAQTTYTPGPAPADVRMSQYSVASSSSRPTSTAEGHQSGFYQPIHQMAMHAPPVQNQTTMVPIPESSNGPASGPGEPPMSEKELLVRLDGEQFRDGAGPSGSVPPPAYTERE